MSPSTPTKVPQMHECRKERKRRTYRKSNQRAHYTHTTKYPRSFANTTIAHSKFLLCIDAKFPPTQQSAPKFHNALKSKVSDYLKRPSKFPPTQQSTPKFHNALNSKVSDYLKQPSKFRDVYPSHQTDTLQFPNLQNHLSRSQKVTKRHPEFLYTHEVREFLTIPHPQRTRPNTHTPPPKPFGVSDSLQNPLPFKEIFHTLGVSTDHQPRHRERAVIRLCACRKMPNTLADVNLP